MAHDIKRAHGAPGTGARRTQKLLRLSDALDLLSARIRRESADPAVALTLRRRFCGCGAELHAIRNEISRRLLTRVDTSADALRRLQGSLGGLAEALTPPEPISIADHPASRQSERRLAALAEGLDSATRLLLLQIKTALAIGVGVVALTAQPAAAACSAAANVETCTGNVPTGGSFTYPSIDTLLASGILDDPTPPSGSDGLSLTTVAPHGASGSAFHDGDPGDTGHDLSATIDTGVHTIKTHDGSGVVVASQGGYGGTGGDAGAVSSAGDGGWGGGGGGVSVDFTGHVSTTGATSHGIVAQSSGGRGGDGGNFYVGGGSAGDGGPGGPGGNVFADFHAGSLLTTGQRSYGIYAASIGGSGGNAGSCSVAICSSSSGGNAAHGGSVEVDTGANTLIQTSGKLADGIHAASIGGFGGNGGNSYFSLSFASNGASAGSGGDVLVKAAGEIDTTGKNANGIFAQSVGGGGGSGGDSSITLFSVGGSGSQGGDGGSVTVKAATTSYIHTTGAFSRGVFAQSIGGGGGDGGEVSGLVAIGGDGSNGSHGGKVGVTNAGTIWTGGDTSDAIFAQSVGGGGGTGGGGGGLVSVGGAAGNGAIGGQVSVDNSGSLLTNGTNSFGVFAQSVGGSGGDGGTVAGVVAVGGTGGTGGDGGKVGVTNEGQISSTGDRSGGVFAQSVGGGGGMGGGAISAGAFLNVSVGGSGGTGGKGGAVSVDTSGVIDTLGERAAAIFAQSVGGGGGSGGYGVGGSVGAFGDISVGVGGKGGAGGDGGAVGVTASGLLSTQGADSDGVFAQSIGGGGGTGGFAVAAAVAGGQAAVSGSVAVGGKGGAGGDGSSVTVASTAGIQTLGDRSAGIYAQSVGGGGGAGGWSGAVAGAGGGVAGAIGVSIGGGGAAAGDGATVSVTAGGGDDGIITHGKDSAGVLAQSVGGGGGTGGFSVAGALAVGKSAGGATLAVGGGGGAGGTGGTVTVSTGVVIGTHGDRSYGVQAQSIGGGGGSGGWAGAITGALSTGASGALSLTLGGGGGAAGAGGTVVLSNTDAVTTAGADAHALFGQSVGGGGGAGGFSVSGALSAGNGTVSVGAAIGGSGGAGGKGGQVTLTSSGGLSTTGDRSYAIFAQSVGGGGGDGGWAGALSGGVSKSESVNLGFSLGGSGGAAGAGGGVSVTTSGPVVTTGADSNGVFAQSVGGGGGTGGLAISAALGGSKSTNLAFGLGGSGGAGGIGGNVTVAVNGPILTEGDGASGVFAQSVGGGGGTGGAAGALTMSGSQSVNLSMNVGGQGGTGSIGGSVTVGNAAVIQTHGEGAHGIFAESIGGGGGHGGMAGIDENQWSQYLAGGSASVSFGSETENISVALGGSGGTGANGGAVTVNNTGAVAVFGDNSNAIYAQSVGGGGGDAGVATAAAGSFGQGQNGTYAIAMGGFGGEAGNGGHVVVNNSGALVSTADGSAGVFAQSVGGGGGAGGSARGFSLSFSNKAAKEGAKKATSVSVSIGGQGGAAGNGGEVDILNSGQIATAGADSFGVFAQSVGGGGGAGGIVSTQGQELVNFLALADKGDAKGGQIAIGGSGAGGGTGGLVQVTNTGLISTQGQGSHGVFAQSVGGGGGLGGSGIAGNVSIGGQGGVAGDGGAVSVVNAGGIYTYGSMARGVFAQSVGGGGGDGGATDFQGETYTYRKELSSTMTVVGNLQDTINLAKSFKEPSYGIQIGGMGGASGAGGAVSVTNNGVIQTSGDLAHGIFAQSVGGGGGTGGEGVIAEAGQIAISGIGGSAGDGGKVTVVNTGVIRTSGFGAYGIYAQSVGGGGGVAGDTSLGLAKWGNLSFAGGDDYSKVANVSLNPLAGHGGDGGDVTVINTGDIILSGDGSLGIFAQSVGGGGGEYGSSVGLSFAGSLGGDGVAGKVTVIQNGAIYAIGKNGIGAFFQSAAGQGVQDITATLNGDVFGGDVYGKGVLIDGGHTNTINLHGFTTAASKLAIVGTTGDDTVNSYVGVYGNVDLGTGANAFNNFEHSTFTTLDYVLLNGGLLTNLGIVTPGGSNAVQGTRLGGSYVQGPGATYDFDLDLKFTGQAGEADRLAATGTAQLQGQYVLNIMDPDHALPGSHAAAIITADSGLTASNLSLVAPASVVAKFDLIHDAHALNIHYAIDFSPDDIGLNPNQLAVGDHINAIQTAGSPAFGPIAAQLFFVSSPDVLKADYNSFMPEAYADQIAAAYLATERFSDSMMSCPLASGHFKFRDNGCVWARATGTWLGLAATGNSQAFTEQSAGVAGGVEARVADHLRLGYALSAENVTGGMGLRSDAHGARYQGGVVAKGDWGDGWGLDLAAAFGTERLATSRIVLAPQQAFTATGHQRVTWQAYTGRISHTWKFDGAYIKPMFEVGHARVHNGALAETGAGPLSLTAPAQEQTETRISPKLEIGAEAVHGRFAYRPYVRGGFTRVLDGDAPLFEAAFSSAPAGAGTFPAAAKLDRMTADAEAGVSVVGPNGASAKLGWFGQFGKRTNEQGMALKFTLPF